MMPDVTLSELMHMARAMTLKYGFCGIPRGGVKAGIVADPEIDPVIKQEILKEFGLKLAPVIKKRIYEPGMDMGIGPGDLSCIWQSAGLKQSRYMKPVTHSRSGYFTGLTVFIAAEAALEKLGIQFNRCTAALEGFGNVGGALAAEYAKRGVKIVAVSTIDGAIYNEKGFDIQELRSQYRRHKSRMINYVNGEIIGMDELFRLNVDILSPCARSWSISEKNADQVQARIVSPGANCAVTPEAEQILADRGILSLPHFVASSGGALGSTMEFLGCTERQILNFTQTEMKKKIVTLLSSAEKEKILPIELAEREALTKFGKMQALQQDTWRSNTIHIAMSMYKTGMLPAILTRKFLPGYLKSKLWSDSILTGIVQ